MKPTANGILKAGPPVLILGLLLFLIGFWWLNLPEVQYRPLRGFEQSSFEKPVGEIIHGFLLEQDISIPKEVSEQTIHLGVPIATYGRENRGWVFVELKQENSALLKRFKSSELKDNQFVYLEISAQEFTEGPAMLRIRGVGGERGSSLTAWSCVPQGSEFPYRVANQRGARRLSYIFASDEVIRPFYFSDQFFGFRPFFWAGLGVLSSVLICLGARWCPISDKEEPCGDAFKNARVWLYCFMACFALKAALLSWFMVPRWSLPDETGHYSYIEDLAKGRGFPVLGDSSMSNWVLEDLGQAEGSQSNWIAQHPPLYYLLMVPGYWIASLIGQDAEDTFKWLRLFSSLWAVLCLPAIYSIIRRFKADPLTALSGAAIFSCIPMVTNLATGIGHDLLLTSLCCWGVYFWVCFRQEDRLRYLWYACALFGLACVTKYTAIVLVGGWFVFTALLCRMPVKRWFLGFGIGGLILVVPLVLWIIRNYLVLSSALPIRADGLTGRLLDLGFIEFLSQFRVPENLFHNGICLLGWISGAGDSGGTFLLYLPGWMWPIYGGGLMLGAGLALGFLWKRHRNEGSKWFFDASFGLVVLSVFMVFGQLCSSRDWLFHYGMLLFIALLVWIGVLFFFCKSRQGEEALDMEFIAACVILVFTMILLYKVYTYTEASGFLRAAHGRYFYPLLGFFVVILSKPWVFMLKQRLWVAWLIFLFMQSTEFVFWLYNGSVFFLR